MEKRKYILEVRQRLDNSLASPDLVDEESVKSLIKNQLLSSSFSGNEGDLGNIVARRTKEVSNFLEMLRSASGDKVDAVKAQRAQSDWKIKQDTDQLRVLYHEGPEGSPFHTLLAEGCVDGPIDTCLAVAWESTLYNKWWPEYTIPTFKLIASACLQKVGIGEEISLIRLKVPWPVSDREAVLHYLEIEYLKEDLILVLLNTISDTEDIDKSSHGFTRDGIPEVKDTVRMSVVGGFVLQKVDVNRTYFRVMANMDIKLDFVPPSLINFISRQLIGSAHKLYLKAVGSVAKEGDDYSEALKGPMYVRIREGLESHNKHKIPYVSSEDEEHIETSATVETAAENLPSTPNTFVTEIVELDTEDCLHIDGSSSIRNSSDSNVIIHNIVEKRPFISPEVQQALDILDRAIATVREGGFFGIKSDSAVVQEVPSLEPVVVPENESMDNKSNADGSPSPAEDFSWPSKDSSVKVNIPVIFNTEKTRSNLFDDKFIGATIPPVQPAFVDRVKVCDEESLQVNVFDDNGPYSGGSKPQRKKEHRICCMNLSFIRI